MYPGGCGYKSETGGIMRNLRESTTNQKVGQLENWDAPLIVYIKKFGINENPTLDTPLFKWHKYVCCY